MKKVVLFGIVGAAVVGLFSAAHTANMQFGDEDLSVNGSPVLTVATNGGLTGEVVTATATSTSGVTAVVYSTPATGDFVLTQLCLYESTNFSSSALLGGFKGSTLGGLAHTGNAGVGEGSCTEYFPGLRIPPGESLSYRTNATGVAFTVVTVTGVYSAP